ncbi:cupin domain-containing protein [Ancylobacter sp. SL191]|uniref:cupin domain-containing protein n=1 Tax=Ancylobacter sp. SL191 TaxID=2995166 RepID=UPI0022702397|nr:cupin domain-containing protein [Ancylobacter sp. SL191]WAC27291.1 cupin domain-containing protein [Ancylobacter sp. SL191]
MEERREPREDAAGAADLGTRLGQMIRALRRDRKLTLAALSEATGLSLGLLSQIERGLSEPSVKALHLIAGSLGVTVGWFFREDAAPATPAPDEVVVRRGARRQITYAGGISDELLTPQMGGQLEFLLCRIAPGTGIEEGYAHEGEEGGYVVAGTLELTVETQSWTLQAGDSFGFASHRPHRYRNPGTHETVVIWAVTPASF